MDEAKQQEQELEEIEDNKRDLSNGSRSIRTSLL